MTSYEAFAQAVVGEPVEVVFVKPSDDDLLGLCCRAHAGRLRIEVHPGLSARDRLVMYLHECGHAVLHRDRLAPPGTGAPSDLELVELARAASPRLGDQFLSEYVSRENEANDLGQRWLDYADHEVGADASESAILDCLIDAAMSGDLPLGRDL